MTTTETRPISAIAWEIEQLWTKPYFGYEPYGRAMAQLSTMDDFYFEDSAKSVLTYALGNMTTWRGEDARRIKAEIKALCASKKGW